MGKSLEQKLISDAKKGLERKLQSINKNNTHKQYHQRLDQELDFICSNRLVEKFVITSDIVKWIKLNDITAGPGRGSTPASLLCYVLGITNVNPFHFKLHPEIFMDSFRSYKANIMMDFCYEMRAKIYTHILDRYSSNWLICCNRPQNEAVLSIARRTFCNTHFLEKEGDNTQKYNPSTAAVNSSGCDLIGQKTLTVNKRACEIARSKQKNVPDLNRLSLHDLPTLSVFDIADTENIVNFESQGIRNLLKICAPNSFNDIASINALYRPGPIKRGMVEEFIARKTGKMKFSYNHPSLKPILEDTFGLIVYQDQILEIAQAVAGYSPEEANIFRKSLLRKNISPCKLAEHKKNFLYRATTQNINPRIAETIFEELAEFTVSAFMKPHNIAYTLLSYQSAYLKAHFPDEFRDAYAEIFKYQSHL